MTAATPVRFTATLDDGEIAGLRWVNDSAPPLLFCHATGFCASAYKQMLSRLAARFDVYALDMRGHGRTALPADPGRLRSWRRYADDIASYLDREGRRDWTLAGHSMGGVTAIKAARGRTDVAALRLIEPVVMPRLYTMAAHGPFWPMIAPRLSIVRQAARRRDRWPSRDDALAAYGRKGLFRDWADGVLADYLEDGLVEDGEGVRLACAPAWEAATFAAQANDFWGAVRGAPGTVSVLAAGAKRSTCPQWARRRLARMGAHVREEVAAAHLLPLERPDLAAEFLAKG